MVDPTLNELYGTTEPAAPSAEEMEKAAQLELLEKIAEEQGFNLAEMSDDEVIDAYNVLGELLEDGVEKTAYGEPYVDDEELQKIAAQEKFAEADYMGRIMAHAYVDELKKIASEGEEEAPKEEKKESLADRLRAAKGEEKEEEKEKKAFDEHVEMRAVEFLKEAGLVTDDGEIVPPEALNPDLEKEAADYGEAVDTAALQVLEHMGYPVTWNR